MCISSSRGVRALAPARKSAKDSGAPRSAFCVRYASAARKCWSNRRDSVTVYRCGAIAVLAFSEVMTGMTSKSTMSLQLDIHVSSSALSSQSIT